MEFQKARRLRDYGDMPAEDPPVSVPSDGTQQLLISVDSAGLHVTNLPQEQAACTPPSKLRTARKLTLEIHFR